MALTIVAEDGTGKSTANSYATVAQGDSYHDGHVYKTSWTGSGTTAKEAALVHATRLLDENFEWTGFKASQTNALQWPRSSTRDRGGFSIASNTMPGDLVNATAELARLLIDADRTAEDDTKGFSKIKVGPVELEMDKADRKGVITPTVARMLAPFGRAIGGGVLRLQRA